MPDDNLLPPPSLDPTQLQLWAGDIRLVIGALVGMGLLGSAWAAVSAEQILNYLTAALIVGSALAGIATSLWGRWAKYKQARLAQNTVVASAVASAQAGTPVRVDAAPPESPDDIEATHIPAAIVAMTPLVTGPIKGTPP